MGSQCPGTHLHKTGAGGGTGGPGVVAESAAEGANCMGGGGGCGGVLVAVAVPPTSADDSAAPPADPQLASADATGSGLDRCHQSLLLCFSDRACSSVFFFQQRQQYSSLSLISTQSRRSSRDTSDQDGHGFSAGGGAGGGTIDGGLCSQYQIFLLWTLDSRWVPVLQRPQSKQYSSPSRSSIHSGRPRRNGGGSAATASVGATLIPNPDGNAAPLPAYAAAPRLSANGAMES